IVEEGSHSALLKRGGLYADLWARQSGGFLAEAVGAAEECNPMSLGPTGIGNGHNSKRFPLECRRPSFRARLSFYMGTMQRAYPNIETFNPDAQQALVRLEALAKLMDGAFIIPGTNIRMGLDGIIGLVPIAGDLISGLISSYLIWEARQLGASRW